PPAGELAFLKKKVTGDTPELATLLEYLPRGTILILSDPASILHQAEQYEAQVPAGDPFFCPWADFLEAAENGGISPLNLFDELDRGQFAGYENSGAAALALLAAAPEDEEYTEPLFTSLEAFRPQL